jgi:hypothetical protein
MHFKFSLRIFDEGKIVASTSKIRGKEEEQPRKTKQLWKSPFGMTLPDPYSFFESLEFFSFDC